MWVQDAVVGLLTVDQEFGNFEWTWVWGAATSLPTVDRSLETLEWMWAWGAAAGLLAVAYEPKTWLLIYPL